MKLRINKNIKTKENNEFIDNEQKDNKSINKNKSSKNTISLNEVRIYYLFGLILNNRLLIYQRKKKKLIH